MAARRRWSAALHAAAASLLVLLSPAPRPTEAPLLRGEREAYGRAARRAEGSRRKAARRAIERESILRVAAGTYIAQLIGPDSTLRRWSDRTTQPLLVWIASGDSLPRWRPQYTEIVREAFAEWERAGVPVRFAFVSDSAAAQVHVRWTARLPQQRAGITSWVADGGGWYRGADVVLAMHASDGTPQSTSGMRAITLHEIGHVLGLEHSPDAGDIMAPWVEARALTARDRATAQLLYALPAGRVR